MTAVAMLLPITFVAVRPMSRIWSIASTSTTPEGGRWNIGATAATTTTEPRATPAMPLLLTMRTSNIRICVPSGMSMPNACAMKIAANA